MEQIIAKLLHECKYIKQDPSEHSFKDAYINRSLKDCIIVCEYTVKELAAFETSRKTQEVMQIFERTNKIAKTFKDTSLVIPLKLSNFDEYDVIKNIILSVEENPYAFRKYIVLYTDSGIAGMDTSLSLTPKLQETLLDADRFLAFEAGKADEEFRATLELYVKLPFMTVRSMQSVELEEFISPLDLEENKKLKEIYDETKHIFSGDYQSSEELIKQLLGNSTVQNYLDGEAK